MVYTYDLIGFGITAIDDLLFIQQFPKPDMRTEIVRSQRRMGGLTSAALVAASRLGAKCAYAGMLGNDDLSQLLLNSLKECDVDITLVLRREGVRPCHSTIIADLTHGTRNIFYDISGMKMRPAETISVELIQQARMVYLDQLDIDVMIHIARLARACGTETVADFDFFKHPNILAILPLIDHLIVSSEMALEYTQTKLPQEAVLKLAQTPRKCTVITDGPRGAYYVEAGNPSMVRHCSAFKVSAVDTTGCGDVFHGAYAAGVAKNMPIEECIQFAAAAAAIKATGASHKSGVPDSATVEQFLQERSDKRKLSGTTT